MAKYEFILEKGKIDMLSFTEFFMKKFGYKNIKGVLYIKKDEGLVEENIEEFENNLREELRKHVDTVSRPLIRGVKGFIKEMSVGGDLIKLLEGLNRNEIILKDGKYNVATKKFKEHNNNDLGLMMSMLPYGSKDLYIKTKPKEFIKFLYEVFNGEPDIKDNIKFIQEFIGLCLVPNTKFEKALYIFGKGGNGKGVLLNTIQSVLGINNTSDVGVSMLGDKQFRYNLLGKLVNIDRDLFCDTFLDKEYVKKIISGERITAKVVYQRGFEFKPFAKLIIASNYMPKTKNVDESITRRFFFLELKNSFVGKEDYDLKSKLEKENKKIFCWALQGLERLLDNKKFTLPKQLYENERKYLRG